MGHSMSLGHCDLATVISRDAALADAAATQAANKVKCTDEIEPTLNKICEMMLKNPVLHWNFIKAMLNMKLLN